MESVYFVSEFLTEATFPLFLNMLKKVEKVEYSTKMDTLFHKFVKDGVILDNVNNLLLIFFSLGGSGCVNKWVH